MWESNPRPSAHKTDALTPELIERKELLFVVPSRDIIHHNTLPSLTFFERNRLVLIEELANGIERRQPRQQDRAQVFEKQALESGRRLQQGRTIGREQALVEGAKDLCRAQKYGK
jgi:hypothetical protein